MSMLAWNLLWKAALTIYVIVKLSVRKSLQLSEEDLTSPPPCDHLLSCVLWGGSLRPLWGVSMQIPVLSCVYWPETVGNWRTSQWLHYVTLAVHYVNLSDRFAGVRVITPLLWEGQRDRVSSPSFSCRLLLWTEAASVFTQRQAHVLLTWHPALSSVMVWTGEASSRPMLLIRPSFFLSFVCWCLSPISLSYQILCFLSFSLVFTPLLSSCPCLWLVLLLSVRSPVSLQWELLIKEFQASWVSLLTSELGERAFVTHTHTHKLFMGHLFSYPNLNHTSHQHDL